MTRVLLYKPIYKLAVRGKGTPTQTRTRCDLLFYFIYFTGLQTKSGCGDAPVALFNPFFAAWGIVWPLTSSIFKINLMHVDVSNVRKNTRANL